MKRAAADCTPGSGERPPAAQYFLASGSLFLVAQLKCEYKAREKFSVLDLRIPIPLPLIGALFQQRLSWSQAFRFFEQSRRPQGIPSERFLESCMPLEFMRLYEGRNDKEELLVIGFD